MKEIRTIEQLEKQYNVRVTKEPQSKYGYCGKVEKVIIKEKDILGTKVKITSYEWLFTYDTFSKAQFVRNAEKELKKGEPK